jgi:hypothetical protein
MCELYTYRKEKKERVYAGHYSYCTTAHAELPRSHSGDLYLSTAGRIAGCALFDVGGKKDFAAVAQLIAARVCGIESRIQVSVKHLCI